MLAFRGIDLVDDTPSRHLTVAGAPFLAGAGARRALGKTHVEVVRYRADEGN